MSQPSIFLRTYIIDFPERTDRLQAVTTVLERGGMPLQPGKVEVFPAVRVQDPMGFPSASARGCFMSHLSILKQAFELGLPNVLILEDDVEFATVFQQVLPHILDQLKKQTWSFAYLGYSYVENAAYASQDTKTVDMKPFSDEIRCTHAYAVHGSALEPVIQHLEQLLSGPPGDREKGPMHVDGAFNIFRKKHPEQVTLIAQPQIAWQRASFSDIHGGGWTSMPAARVLLSPARSFKNYLQRISR